MGLLDDGQALWISVFKLLKEDPIYSILNKTESFLIKNPNETLEIELHHYLDNVRKDVNVFLENAKALFVLGNGNRVCLEQLNNLINQYRHFGDTNVLYVRYLGFIGNSLLETDKDFSIYYEKSGVSGFRWKDSNNINESVIAKEIERFTKPKYRELIEELKFILALTAEQLQNIVDGKTTLDNLNRVVNTLPARRGLADNFEVALMQWYIELADTSEMIFGKNLVAKFGAKKVEGFVNALRREGLNFEKPRKNVITQLGNVRKALDGFPNAQKLIDNDILKLM